MQMGACTTCPHRRFPPLPRASRLTHVFLGAYAIFAGVTIRIFCRLFRNAGTMCKATKPTHVEKKKRGGGVHCWSGLDSPALHPL